MKHLLILLLALAAWLPSKASEASLVLPPLSAGQSGLLMIGFVDCFLGLLFGLLTMEIALSQQFRPAARMWDLWLCASPCYSFSVHSTG